MSATPKDVVETYANTLYEGHTCHRYRIGNWPILVGGSIRDAADFEHLVRDFGVTHVVNVETEHDDVGKVPPERLLQVRVEDRGAPFPPEAVLSACLFVARELAQNERAKFYVHCQQGGSRSPGFAYALLRGVFRLSREDAVAQIIDARGGNYNTHEYHRSYMESADGALASLP